MRKGIGLGQDAKCAISRRIEFAGKAKRGGIVVREVLCKVVSLETGWLLKGDLPSQPNVNSMTVRAPWAHMRATARRSRDPSSSIPSPGTSKMQRSGTSGEQMLTQITSRVNDPTRGRNASAAARSA